MCECSLLFVYVCASAHMLLCQRALIGVGSLLPPHGPGDRTHDIRHGDTCLYPWAVSLAPDLVVF